VGLGLCCLCCLKPLGLGELFFEALLDGVVGVKLDSVMGDLVRTPGECGADDLAFSFDGELGTLMILSVSNLFVLRGFDGKIGAFIILSGSRLLVLLGDFRGLYDNRDASSKATTAAV